MKRLTLIPGLILTALGAAALAGAEQNGPGPHPRMGFALRGMEKCLANADVSPDARSAAQAALVAGRDILKTDGAALKAAHEKMHTDIANGADKAVVGQDAIDADAARTKLQSDAKAIHDQVLGALSPDEQAAVQACLSAHAGAWKHGPRPEPPTQ